MSSLTVEAHVDNDQADDEVAFWRRIITWWAQVKTEPVPARAWEALARAERLRSAPTEDPLCLSDYAQAKARLRPASPRGVVVRDENQ